jgi:undecaprenyl pyrophosphate phosphatase UppP
MFTSILFFGMLTLGSWAAVNIYFWYKNRNTAKDSTHYFWQMNGLWNVINLSIAMVSTLLVSARLNAYRTDANLQDLQVKIVAFNIILDVLYIAAGFYLEHRGKTNKNERLIGYGNAIQLQGAFLFFFDSIFALALIVATL